MARLKGGGKGKNNNARGNDVQPQDYSINDYPTRFVHPLIKTVVNAFAVALLGSHFNKIGQEYFTSVLVLCIPLLLDSLEYAPNFWIRDIIRKIEIGLLIILCSISFFGYTGVVSMVNNDGNPRIMISTDYIVAGGFDFSARYVWFAIVASLALAAIGWFSIKTEAEVKINEYKGEYATTAGRRK